LKKFEGKFLLVSIPRSLFRTQKIVKSRWTTSLMRSHPHWRTVPICLGY